MNVLITGGTGLIGAKVAERLLLRGERVILFDIAIDGERVDQLRQLTGARPTVDLLLEKGDVCILAGLAEMVRRHRIDRILHLASMLGPDSNANPSKAIQVNLGGAVNVLDAARLFDLERVVLASSIAVYGRDSMYPPEVLPLTEDAPQYGAPGMLMYGAGKIYLEHLAAHYGDQFGVEAVGLRPSIVSGLGRRTGATAVINTLIEDPALGRPVNIGFGDARLSLVYVDDVADQFVALLDAPSTCFSRHRFFNSGGVTCTVRQLADVVHEIVPNAVIEVSGSDESDFGGLAASVSGDALESALGHRRMFAQLEDSVLAQMNAMRARAGVPPLVAD